MYLASTLYTRILVTLKGLTIFRTALSNVEFCNIPSILQIVNFYFKLYLISGSIKVAQYLFLSAYSKNEVNLKNVDLKAFIKCIELLFQHWQRRSFTNCMSQHRHSFRPYLIYLKINGYIKIICIRKHIKWIILTDTHMYIFEIIYYNNENAQLVIYQNK